MSCPFDETPTPRHPAGNTCRSGFSRDARNSPQRRRGLDAPIHAFCALRRIAAEAATGLADTTLGVLQNRHYLRQRSKKHGFTGSTPPRLDRESFAESCPLALLGNAFYPVPVHRLAARSTLSHHTHPVVLMQLRFASSAVISPRWDLAYKSAPCRAHQKKEPACAGSLKLQVLQTSFT